MKKHLLTLVCTTILSISTFAQSGSGRVSLGTGLLYEIGWDVTLLMSMKPSIITLGSSLVMSI